MMTALTALEILKAARERIANPENWLQGDLALTADGEGTCETSPYATKFCSLGAIHTDYTEETIAFAPTFAAATSSLAVAIETLHNTGLAYHRTHSTDFIADWNDKAERKHSEVLTAFDLAIAMQEAV